jgi:hypothetical protein
MQNIQELLKNRKLEESPPKKRFTNERQYIIEQMVQRINSEREGTKWKPVTWKQINGMVRHLKGFELNWFYVEACKRANFSKYFFWALKTKK